MFGGAQRERTPLPSLHPGAGLIDGWFASGDARLLQHPDRDRRRLEVTEDHRRSSSRVAVRRRGGASPRRWPRSTRTRGRPRGRRLRLRARAVVRAGGLRSAPRPGRVDVAARRGPGACALDDRSSSTSTAPTSTSSRGDRAHDLRGVCVGLRVCKGVDVRPVSYNQEQIESGARHSRENQSSFADSRLAARLSGRCVITARLSVRPLGTADHPAKDKHDCDGEGVARHAEESEARVEELWFPINDQQEGSGAVDPCSSSSTPR